MKTLARSIRSEVSRPRAAVLAAALAFSLTGCGGSGAPAGTQAETAGAAVPGSAQQVEARVGTATVRAVVMQTSNIPESVAREHGIERSENAIMLRVSPRTGPEGAEVSAPVKVSATVTGLRGVPQTLEMKTVDVGGLVDHVGTVRADLPDTLRFDVRVVSPQGQSETLRITRDFQPLR